jgi:uncharacterized protein YndB with AHSA1/START domain
MLTVKSIFMENSKFNVSKDFTVPVEALYQAWTSEAQLKQWWKPMQHQLTEVKNELQEGGNIEYRFSGNAEDLVITGHPNEKLVYTWNWHMPGADVPESEYVLDIGFSAADNGSKITVEQRNFASEESIKPHQQGWVQALDDLAAFLGTTSASKPEGTVNDHIDTVDYG